ncbi:hypothetical protein GGR56DRAFT_692979 [Xylariaceae sp. FL0804]|nr:hypothetical protein GGR56DRAFT_692979 [Xylariaceae sp. FL0804]
MGAFYEAIPPSLVAWILAQRVFWVATAPLSAQGHVNVSPKGGGSDNGRSCFGVPDARTFWYQDLSGSGSETIAHLHEPGNGRATVCFCAFDGPPRIVRLWGQGRVLEAGTPAFADLAASERIALLPGVRSLIVVDVHQAGASCGFAVPLYDFRAFRTTLDDALARQERRYRGSGDGEEGDERASWDRYWAWKNAYSMDGMPGMQRGLKAGAELSIAPIRKMVGPLVPKNQNVRRPGHRRWYATTTTRLGERERELQLLYAAVALLSLAVALLAATHPALQQLHLPGADRWHLGGDALLPSAFRTRLD